MDLDDVGRNTQLRTLSGEYADLLSIKADLQFVADAARRYAELDASADPDGVLKRALWWSAVISYRRCFTSGRGHGSLRRKRLTVPDPAIQGLEEAEGILHLAALDTANQHVGHRVGNLEQIPVSLLFREGPSGHEVAGIAVLGTLYLGPVPDEARSLADLADHLRHYVEAEIANQQGRVLAAAKELLARKQ